MQDMEKKGKLPRQIPYIIANEACERFSFYGMRNILTIFLITSLLTYLPEAERAGEAKHTFHSFVIGVYFFPLLGGWLADKFFGKYNTIFWFSLIYCAGHACLAMFEHNLQGFYLGLCLIALGSGGIKPLVASFMGDQFDKSNKHMAVKVYDAFYWSINLGSFFASLLMPIFLKKYGAAVAFGIPGVLMFIATLVFWLGNRKYVHVPPAPHNPDSFLNVVKTALFTAKAGESNPGLLVAQLGWVAALASLYYGFTTDFIIGACGALVLVLATGGMGVSMQLERARGKHSHEAVDGVRAVLRILIVFALVTPFWSLFDQKASTWVIQAKSMVPVTGSLLGWNFSFEASQMQALNPLLVMLLIPFNNLVLFPVLRKIGYEPTALRRMTAGIAFAGVSWIVVGMMQGWLDAGEKVSMAWQVLPYALLTIGEVLVFATGLEFAYSQAPAAMKGVIMSFFNLTITVGGLWVLLVNESVKSPAVIAQIQSSGHSVIGFQMYFFAGFALVTAMVFGWYSKYYQMVDNYRSVEAPAPA